MQSTFRTIALTAVVLGITACGETPTEVPPTVTPTEMAFHFGAPLPWLGYQDGNGAWTEVKGVQSATGHTYSLTMTAPVGGIAWVFTTTCAAINWVDYGTPAELKARYSGFEAKPAGLKTVHGSVAGGFASGYSTVRLGGVAGGFDFVDGEAGSFTLAGVPLGPQDLVASRNVSWNSTDKFIVRRNLDVANGATIPLLDFSSSEAIALDSARLTLQDFGGSALTYAPVSASVSIYTANGGRGWSTAATTNGTTWYRGLPTSATIAGDMHQITANAAGRSVTTFIGPLADHTIPLGPAAATPTVTTVSSGTPMRRRMTIPVQPEYSKSAHARFETGTRPYYVVNMSMTAAYRGSATSWIFEIPDFGASSGYNSAWGLQGGPSQSWSATVVGWPGTGNPVPAVGLTQRSASVQSTSATPSAVPSFGQIESEQFGRPTPEGALQAQLSCLPG